MRAAIHKQTYTDGQAYRYRILDEAGHVCYLAEPTGLWRPSPTRLIELFDPNHNRIGRLQPPAVVRWWRENRYTLFFGEEVKTPSAVIREQLRLVDMLLLRLPRYEIQLEGRSYVVRGSRYGRQFYEIFHLPGGDKKQADEEGNPGEVRVGQIQRSTVGPSYIIETDDARLSQALFALVALVVLIDVESDY